MFTIGAYAEAYMKVYRRSGLGFLERVLAGLEGEMTHLCVGTLNELYDGNPPYKGHGGISYAPSVAAMIDIMQQIQVIEQQIDTEL